MKLFSHILAKRPTLKTLYALLGLFFRRYTQLLLTTHFWDCLTDGARKLITKSLNRHRFGCRSLLKFYAFINVTDN